MAVLVSNATPWTVWRAGGGLVGACKTLEQAEFIARDLKSGFPQNDYICKDIDGNIQIDTRTT